MKVYLVIESEFDEGAGEFETVLDVWADETVAELRVLELREKNDFEFRGYRVVEFEVQ